MAEIKDSFKTECSVLSIGDTKYFVPSQCIMSLESAPQRRSPVTVINVEIPHSPTSPLHAVNDKWIEKVLNDYQNLDDVFHTSFLTGVIFYGGSEEEIHLTLETRRYLCKLGNEWIRFISPQKTTEGSVTSQALLPGPYMLFDGQLHDIWKIEDDCNGTLMTALRPSLSLSGFDPLNLKGNDGISSSVALPSRLRTYSVPTVSPIAGWRIVVKDNIHLEGIKSSMGNRAFYDTYGPQQKTADCVQRLIDQGAIVLGKTKMTSFGNWEEPVEYVDYQAPWNARADGYQSPGGSSSGSAAAIAAYDWVDIAIGTDTWGSITRPALWCGCFGLRPSIGAVSSTGVEPSVKAWDIPGFLGRDLEKCRLFAKAWLRDEALIENPKPFSAIIWPAGFWSIIDSDQCELARNFMQEIKENLGVKHWDISFEDTWINQPPDEANDLSLADFINPATASLACDAYNNSIDFQEQYRKEFHREPFTRLPNRQLWEAGKAFSKQERDDGIRKIEVYARWFRETILKENRANALMILPLEGMSPRYRDEVPNFERPPQQGINTLALAPVLKAPALAVPIAEIPYESRISQITEKIPFAVCVVSPPGTDLALLECVRDVLVASGRPTVVKTGRSMFEGPEM